LSIRLENAPQFSLYPDEILDILLGASIQKCLNRESYILKMNPSFHKPELLPISTLGINLAIQTYSIFPSIFLMSDEPAKIVILSIFLFTVAIMLISFHSQLGSKVFSSAIFLAAAILSFLMALLLPFFFLIGIVNVLSFGYNFKKVRRPELTRKQLFLLIILLITILPIFIPYSFEVEGKNRIILQFYTKPEDIPEEAIPVLREREKLNFS
jgi:hypothetical protein